jgi:hypothetical protein
LKSARGKQALLGVFVALTKPLMRLALEYGVSAGDIAAVIRRTYIQELEKSLLEQKRSTTDARLALLAGLTKSDVSALRESLRGGTGNVSESIALDHIASFLTAWHTQPGFCGAYGLPLDLDLVPTRDSPSRSFHDLAIQACPGVDEDMLLDKLLTSKSVEVIASRTVRCLSRAYLPEDTDVTRLEWVGRLSANVVASGVHNLLRDGEKQAQAYFARAVVSDLPLSLSARDRFLAVSAERGQALLTELDSFLTHLEGADSGGSGQKYGVGVFCFEDQTNIGQSPATADLRASHSKEMGERHLEEIDVLKSVRSDK